MALFPPNTRGPSSSSRRWSSPCSADSICSMEPRTSSMAPTAHGCGATLGFRARNYLFCYGLFRRVLDKRGGQQPAPLEGGSGEGTRVCYLFDRRVLGLQSQTLSWLKGQPCEAFGAGKVLLLIYVAQQLRPWDASITFVPSVVGVDSALRWQRSVPDLLQPVWGRKGARGEAAAAPIGANSFTEGLKFLRYLQASSLQ